jgi:hypothetical protein
MRDVHDGVFLLMGTIRELFLFKFTKCIFGFCFSAVFQFYFFC